MIKKIYIDEWHNLKPYESNVPTDTYYLKLSNEIKRILKSNEQALIFQMYLEEDDIDLLSCFLCSYFEDIISETNIWNSFVSIHKTKYNKTLPFYELENYIEKEINNQDIYFLIWYFINTIQESKFISPFNDFIYFSGDKIMEIFEREWENAPINEQLQSFYQISENEIDYYEVRKRIDTILFKTYLFFPDTGIDFFNSEFDVFEEHKHDPMLMNLLNENRDNNLHKLHTRLLSLKGSEWAQEIVRQNNQPNKELFEISKKIQGYFLYKGQDNENIKIEHIASGKEFLLTKKSYDHSDSLNEIDEIIHLGMVKWQNEWWFSGVSFIQPFNADLILDEKNSISSRSAVNFIDHEQFDTSDLLNKQRLIFEAFNDGSQIAFLKTSEIDKFNADFVEFYNKSLNLSDKQIKAASDKAKKDGLFIKDSTIDFSDHGENGLVFFNPKSGCEIAFDVNSSFPLPNNPFYNDAENEEHVLHVLINEDISKELALFCIEHCKNKLPFFKKDPGKAYLEDIDFLLRFWKKSNYHTQPSITYTGSKNK